MDFCNSLYWALSTMAINDRNFAALQLRLVIRMGEVRLPPLAHSLGAQKFGAAQAGQIARGLEFVAMLDSLPPGCTAQTAREHLEKVIGQLNISKETPLCLPIDPRCVKYITRLHCVISK